jgi:hypothetical protein
MSVLSKLRITPALVTGGVAPRPSCFSRSLPQRTRRTYRDTLGA